MSCSRLFWTSIDVSRLFARFGGIETALMSGYERHWLFTDEAHYPRGLSIDHPAKRLYWSDTKLRTIYSCKLDGKDIQLVHTYPHPLDHPYQLAVFEDFLYVNIVPRNRIHRLHKFGGRRHNSTVMSVFNRRVTHLIVMQENLQKIDSEYMIT